MSENKDHKLVIEYLKIAKPRSEGHKILSQDNFFGGKVTHAEYTEDENLFKTWVTITKKHKSHVDSENQLVQQLESARIQNSNGINWYDRIFNMSGLIALVLIIPFVYLTLVSPEGNVPDHLKTLVLTITGFYFGSFAKSKLESKNE
ncbi:hypothetical protein [Psychrobacter sp.]|uniref:hypothetical protein n=1 Tax=Psychrobacter sp. TaxID=56811 RepID=UPI003568BADE